MHHFEPFGDPLRGVDRLTSQLLSGARTPHGMPMDVWREGDAFHVALDLPGVDPAAVDVQAERNTLTIRAERRTAIPEGADVLVAERAQGNYTRQLTLGDGLDTEAITAEYRDGVLHLTIPISSSAQARRIEISHGDAAQAGGNVIDGETGQSEGATGA